MTHIAGAPVIAGIAADLPQTRHRTRAALRDALASAPPAPLGACRRVPLNAAEPTALRATRVHLTGRSLRLLTEDLRAAG